MKEPVMMETVRLQKGDVLIPADGDFWDIHEEKTVHQPNTQVSTDALGNLDGNVKKIPRLKFRSRNGAWEGYIFPHCGLCVAIQSDGYREYVVWEKQLEQVVKIIPRDPPPSECNCAM